MAFESRGGARGGRGGSHGGGRGGSRGGARGGFGKKKKSKDSIYNTAVLI